MHVCHTFSFWNYPTVTCKYLCGAYPRFLPAPLWWQLGRGNCSWSPPFWLEAPPNPPYQICTFSVEAKKIKPVWKGSTCRCLLLASIICSLHKINFIDILQDIPIIWERKKYRRLEKKQGQRDGLNEMRSSVYVDSQFLSIQHLVHFSSWISLRSCRGSVSFIDNILLKNK